VRRVASDTVSYVTSGARDLVGALTRDPELATRRQRWAGAALILATGLVLFAAAGR
jgi:hypothetical protein